ncbi:hypothetical protein [Aquabacterium sp.]|uniref:hypothetical protein n=1 Tax=Aquabacterium sp. TaxID=1872578 RepID=UPI002C667695|nr:hypothetical protein [Aquabacterium sp.]HSW04800.1 hypothetical protein [Aquabacterium sp.]
MHTDLDMMTAATLDSTLPPEPGAVRGADRARRPWRPVLGVAMAGAVAVMAALLTLVLAAG